MPRGFEEEKPQLALQGFYGAQRGGGKLISRECLSENVLVLNLRACLMQPDQLRQLLLR